MGDRKDLPQFAPEFREFRPDVVIDVIPLTEEDARLTVRTFTGMARRLVIVSSQDVYLAYGRVTGFEPGPPVAVPLSEDSPLRTRLHPYRGKAEGYDSYEKILVERLASSAVGLPATILRLPMVYGPGDTQHRLFPHLTRMDDHRPAIVLQEGLASWRWSRGYVGNVALAIAMAAVDDRAAGRTYNVAEPDALTMAEWVQAVGKVIGWRGRVVEVPRDRLPGSLRAGINQAQDLIADTSRLRLELGYAEEVPREEAICNTVTWERANPPEDIELDYEAEDRLIAAYK